MNNVKCKRIIAILLSVLLFISNFLFFSPNYIRSYAKEDIEIENSYDYSEESDSEIKTDNDISTEEELSITNDETSEENDELSEESTELTDDTEELLEESTELTDDTEELLEENTELTDDTEELSEENTELTEKLDLTMPSNISILQSGIYGYELNKQGTKIGVNTYIDGNLNASFNESILRFQTASVYCYDINKRFYETDDYTYHTERPDIFSQDDQDTIALIVYYFDNIVGTLDSRPAVQYYYTQCCLWNYIHSVNPAFNQYTTYIQVAECNKSNEEQQAIFDACMAWVNENKSNYTTSMQYWTNNEGDYQPVLHTNAFYEEKKGTISVNKSSANVSITNGNDNYSLQGAVYGIYLTQEDASNDSNRVTTITTDELGHGESEELSFATYYVKEITASKGYSLDTKIYTVTINSTVKSAIVSSAESPDSGKISLVKSSSNTSISNGNSNYTLQGAVYGVYKSETNAKNNTDKVASITTDEEGKGEVTGLSYGTYYVKEITASKGYSLDTKIYTVTINSTVKSAIVSSAESPDSGRISLVKSSSNTSISNGNSNYTLQGAVYGVYKSETNAKNNTDKVASITTDEEGKGEVTGLSYGTYYVKEITASKGYSLDTKVYTATINSTIKSATVSSVEKPNLGKISLIKASSDTSYTSNNSYYSLQGAIYGVYKKKTDANADINRVTSITTDVYGKGVSSDLPFGTYYVKEIKASKGYNLDSNIYETVTNETVQTATVSSSEKPDSGKIKVEKASSNTVLTKDNNCYSLQGAVYSVYRTRSDANAGTNRVTTITTDASGKGESGDLPFGKYYVKETQASKGYNLDSKVYEAEISSTVKSKTVSSAEIPQDNPIDIILKKNDSENKKPVEGAVYEIKYYAAETESLISNTTYRRHWYLKTDSDGTAKLNSLYITSFNKKSSDEFYFNSDNIPTIPLGYITIQEVESPVEYVMDDTTYTYKVTDHMLRTEATNKAVEPTISERPKKQAFQLIKLSEDGTNDLKPLANAGFMAWKVSELSTDDDGNYIFDTSKAVELAQDGSKEMFTDEDGYALSAELRYGTYIVKETTIPDGYNPVADFIVDVTIDSRTPQKIVYKTDTQKKYYLRITKFDSTTEHAVLNNSSAYRIWSYKDNDYVAFRTYTGSGFELVSEFNTGNDGILMTPGTLTYGDYRLEEITAPKGYNLDTPEGIDFTINDNTIYITTENIGDTVSIVDIVCNDTPVFGRYELYKEGEIRKWDEDSGNFITEVIPLADIEFGIYAGENIYTYDGAGTIIYEEGELAYTITTDAEGKAYQDGIPLGKYVVKELNTPDDFIKVSDIDIEFKIDDKKTDADGLYCVEQTSKLLNKAYYPKVKTTAVDNSTKEHTGVVGEEVTITDKVYMTDLVVGRTYLVKGKLYDTETGEIFRDYNGEEVTSELEFTAETVNQTVELEFTFDSTDIAGESITVFEELYYNDEKVALHADISDTEQQIHYVDVKTTAVDTDTLSHTGVEGEKSSIIDYVKVTNLVIGKEYTIKGKLYNSDTGEVFLDDDKEVTAEKTFTADKKDMTVELEFTFDSTSLAGETIVVFEDLYHNEIKVASHADLEDKEQHVSYPSVSTKAMDKDT
ncbi:MAG: VaFE repeat-containing surface-anchored protein, partial [Lachnospiraceae bacterium]|nr:VaFE repeat-containing surface-anchored protein [Lachnospiraceae bacterium]